MCSNLKTIKLPSTLKEINNFAFASCILLTDIELPDSLLTIGNDAFIGCRSLKSINLPDSVYSIGKSAFEDCIELEKIYLPISITALNTDEENPFKGCTSLTDVYYGGTENQWDAIKEELKSSLTSTVVHFNAKKSRNFSYSRCKLRWLN